MSKRQLPPKAPSCGVVAKGHKCILLKINFLHLGIAYTVSLGFVINIDLFALSTERIIFLSEKLNNPDFLKTFCVTLH